MIGTKLKTEKYLVSNTQTIKKETQTAIFSGCSLNCTFVKLFFNEEVIDDTFICFCYNQKRFDFSKQVMVRNAII